MNDPRHISYLYSKVLFNDNIQQIVNYINQQSSVLENQRLNNIIDVRQLVLLGQCYFELKTIEGFRKSMEFYREAMDYMALSPFSTKQVDYAYVLACHAVSYHSHEYYVDGKRDISRFSKKLREPKDVYDQIEAALSILTDIQYSGPQIGVIINMYLGCVFSCGKTAVSMQYEEAEIEYLKALAKQSLVNLKGNGLPDFNVDVADGYCMLGCIHLHYKDKKLARGYFNKAIELYSQLYNPQTHPKISFVYSRILTTILDLKDQNNGLKAIAIKRAYYGHSHFEVIDPLYSTYVCLLKNNSYNITVENDLNATQKLNGLKTNSEHIWGNSCCTIL